MSRLRLIIFQAGHGLCLFARLPGGRRLLLDCAGQSPAASIRYLRSLGALGPLKPLDAHLGPSHPQAQALAALPNNIAAKSGGCWLHFQALPAPAAGFALRARLGGAAQQGEGSLLLMQPGGGQDQARPGALLLLPGAEQHLLLACGLPRDQWRGLLASPQARPLLGQVQGMASGALPGNNLLEQQLICASLPWLVMAGCPRPGAAALATPPVGALELTMRADGYVKAAAWPLGDNPLQWQAPIQPLDGSALAA